MEEAGFFDGKALGSKLRKSNKESRSTSFRNYPLLINKLLHCISWGYVIIRPKVVYTVSNVYRGSCNNAIPCFLDKNNFNDGHVFKWSSAFPIFGQYSHFISPENSRRTKGFFYLFWGHNLGHLPDMG